MEAIKTSDLAELSDPKLRRIAQRVIRTFELSIDKVAAHHADPTRFPLAREAGSIEAMLNARFETLRASTKRAAATAATQRLQAAPVTRRARLDDLVAVDVHSAQPIEAQVRALSFPDALKLPPSFTLARSEASSATASAAAAPTPISQLAFCLSEVKCIDETGEGIAATLGSDEMSIGGASVDENGGTLKIAPIKIASFDTGDVKKYQPPLEFCSFNLKEGNAWPKCYLAVLGLVEVDMGGFSDFLDGLFKKAREEVKIALMAAFGTVGMSGGPVGALIGLVVGYVVTEVFALLEQIWKDEIFLPCKVETKISSFTHRFAGNRLVSPDVVATFKGHGGKYQCVGHWKLSA